MTATTLAAALTANSQTISLAGGTLSVDSLIAVDSEYVLAWKLISATQAFVQRGVNGSTAAAHSNGTTATIGSALEFLTGPAMLPPFGPDQDVLTAQGPSSSPVYSSGQFVHQATVTLTNAQIKALPTTRVTLVAAQGANTVIVPMSAVVVQSFPTTAYTNVDASAALDLSIAANVITTDADISATFTATAPITYVLEAKTVAAGLSTTALVNQPLQVRIANGSAGVFTAGAADNSLIVTVSYSVINSTTGIYA